MASPESFDHQEETPEQEQASAALREMARNVENALSQKTTREKFLAEQQTRKVPLEQQRLRKEPVERSELNRFERGQMVKAYKIMRTEIGQAEKGGERAVPQRELLMQVRERARELQHGLDTLEGQFEHNVQEVPVETKYGEFLIPITELDLQKPADGADDDRVPYVFWGGINSNVETNGCVLMALALAGEKVIGIPHFEQKQVKKPKGVTAAGVFREEQGFGAHAQVAMGVLKQLGLKKFNLIGYSTGATISLETAAAVSRDEALQDKLQDVIAIEPVGFEEIGLEGLALGLGRNIVGDMPLAETRLKVLQHAAETNAAEQSLPLEPEAVKVLGKKHVTAEKLADIACSGKFEIWSGTNSGLQNIPFMEKTVGQAQGTMAVEHPGASQPRLVEVKDATHYSPIVNAMGFVHEILRENGNEDMSPKLLNKKDLANSAVSQLLQDIGR